LLDSPAIAQRSPLARRRCQPYIRRRMNKKPLKNAVETAAVCCRCGVHVAPAEAYVTSDRSVYCSVCFGRRAPPQAA
jgi:hypothetical protein